METDAPLKDIAFRFGFWNATISPWLSTPQQEKHPAGIE